MDFDPAGHDFLVTFKINTKPYVIRLPNTGPEALYSRHVVANTHTDQPVVLLNAQYYPKLRPLKVLKRGEHMYKAAVGAVH